MDLYVVKQGSEQGACQFSWWCDGNSDEAEEDEAYAAAKEKVNYLS